MCQRMVVKVRGINTRRGRYELDDPQFALFSNVDLDHLIIVEVSRA